MSNQFLMFSIFKASSKTFIIVAAFVLSQLFNLPDFIPLLISVAVVVHIYYSNSLIKLEYVMMGIRSLIQEYVDEGLQDSEIIAKIQSQFVDFPQIIIEQELNFIKNRV